MYCSKHTWFFARFCGYACLWKNAPDSTPYIAHTTERPRNYFAVPCMGKTERLSSLGLPNLKSAQSFAHLKLASSLLFYRESKNVLQFIKFEKREGGRSIFQFPKPIQLERPIHLHRFSQFLLNDRSNSIDSFRSLSNATISKNAIHTSKS